MTTIIIFIILYVLILSLSFYFSGSETGFITLNAEHLADDSKSHQGQEDKKIKKSFLFNLPAHNLDLILGVTLLGNNLANIGLTYIGDTIWSLIAGESYLWIYILGSTFLFLIIGEVCPKILFKTYAYQLMSRVGFLFVWFSLLFKPLVWFILQITSFFSAPFLLFKSRQTLSQKDLDYFIESSLEEGVIEQTEKDFISAMLLMSKTAVVEVMEPLSNFYFINKQQDVNLVMDEIFKTKKNIVLVYESRIDNIVGLINPVDIFNATKRKNIASDLMHEAYYVPELLKINKMYEMFSEFDNKFFIAVDEYGSASGMVDSKSIIERIFSLEHNTINQNGRDYIKKKSPFIYEVSTRCEIDEINKICGLSLPKKGYKTISGYLNELFNGLPKEGDIRIEKDFIIRILKSKKTGAEKIKLHLLSKQKEKEKESKPSVANSVRRRS